MLSKNYFFVMVSVALSALPSTICAAEEWVRLDKEYNAIKRMEMTPGFKKAVEGYGAFRTKYAYGDDSIMRGLYKHGQKPEIMVVACADSRVDPALVTQSDPGDLFVVRNVANLVPPYELDGKYHGTSAALEYAVNHLKVKHLIILGHSQCGGVQASLDGTDKLKSDFIGDWVSLIKQDESTPRNADDYAKLGLLQSRDNCMTYPWIKEAVDRGELTIHLWFFDIKKGQLYTYAD
jgi:carbonic anhydrase